MLPNGSRAFQSCQEGRGVNILAWNCKLFPKRIFQDQKLFPRIYFFKFENCFTPLVSDFGFDRISPGIAPLNVWKVASLEPKLLSFSARSKTKQIKAFLLLESLAPKACVNINLEHF